MPQVVGDIRAALFGGIKGIFIKEHEKTKRFFRGAIQ